MTLAVELAHIEVCKLQVPVEVLLAPGADEWERAEETVVPGFLNVQRKLLWKALKLHLNNQVVQ